MKVTILMPALNEEKAIGETIKRIPLEEIQKAGFETEVLIVDGGSEDKTREIAKSLGARVLVSPRGYGAQYRFGFEKSEGEIIVTADSDSSYPMEEIPDLLKIFEEEKLDFLTTNRFAKLREGSMRKLNRLGNWGLTLAVNFLFGLGIKDSQSGMWVIRKEALSRIKLESSGMPLSQEIKIEAFRKLRSREADSSYHKRDGETKLRVFQDGWENLWHLIKKRMRGV
jgi:glycosyltransferase involved in cell wall biosynthesis